MKYANLHLHTHFSLYDGAMSPADVRDECLREGHIGAAITDHGTLGGVFQFWKTMHSASLKAVIGCEFYIGWGKDSKLRGTESHSYHIALLAANQEGYRNLVRLHNIASKQFYKKPKLRPLDLERHSNGIICLSGCLASLHARALQNGQYTKALAWLQYLKQVYQERLFLEIQPHQHHDQKHLNEWLLDHAPKLCCSVVATADSHHTCNGHFDYQTLMSTKKHHDGDLQLPFGTCRNMATLPPKALEMSHEILEYCKPIELKAPRTMFPVVQPSLISEMLYVARSKAPCEQLEYEIQVISDLGFLDYFGAIYDCKKYCDNNNIHWNYGRGSVAGSLFAFAIGITEIDPRLHGLFFERFLNPSRVSLPDIDTDIQHNRRGEVISYLERQYGKVYGICTYQRSGYKTAIRDVARATGQDVFTQNNWAKALPSTFRGIDPAPEDCSKALLEYGVNPQIVRACEVLVDKPRSVSKHAGAIVIVPDHGQDLPVTKDDAIVWEMGDVEEAGFVKYDYLGLTTLSVVAPLRDKYGKPNPHKDFNHKTKALAWGGKLTRTFQIGSGGIAEFTKRFKPQNVEDLAAILALYRPGPLDSGVAERVLQIRAGHFDNSNIPLFIYQEDIMRYARDKCGYSLADADSLRKAIGKKKPEELAKHAPNFDPEVWEAIKSFGDYAFNKSHAVAYAYLSFETMYWKAMYPAEFYASDLRCYADKKQGFIPSILSARHEMGLTLLPPKPEEWSTVALDDKTIQLGMDLLKGCGKKPRRLTANHRSKALFAESYWGQMKLIGCPVQPTDIPKGYGLVCHVEQKTAKSGRTYYQYILDCQGFVDVRRSFDEYDHGDLITLASVW